MWKVIVYSLWLGSSSADCVTTAQSLSRGASESYGVLSGHGATGVCVATVAAASATAYLSMTQRFWRDHRKVAIGMAVAGASLHTWASLHNIHVAR